MNEFFVVLYYAISGVGLMVGTLFAMLWINGRQHRLTLEILTPKWSVVAMFVVVVGAYALQFQFAMPLKDIAQLLSFSLPICYMLGFIGATRFHKPAYDLLRRSDDFWTAIMCYGQISHVRFFVLGDHDIVREVYDPFGWKQWYELRVACGSHVVEVTKLDAEGYELLTVFTGTTSEQGEPCPFTTRVWGKDCVEGFLSADTNGAKGTHAFLKELLAGCEADEIKERLDHCRRHVQREQVKKISIVQGDRP